MNLNTKAIRRKFLDFFEQKQHKIVSPAPIVNKDDPTLMFTNAGMNQFKDYFLGNKDVRDPRVVDTQPCLRVSGKHNDLEEVGIDTYHHTLFEMIGNWSFGDYFKREAIEWAWEFLTQVLNIDKDRIYVTVFDGDKEDDLDQDAEAYDIWKSLISPDRIIFAPKKDNFWEMGDTGPCGPCSEIHVDMRDQGERREVDGKTLVNQDHPQVIEIWNLVFIQYNRMASGQLEELPEKHVDTGMGLERLAMVIQDKKSTYETDVFSDLISKISEITNHNYGQDEKIDIALRVIADHIRAVIIAIADGLMPSNTGAGYVIRRILRRAVRYAYSYLDIKDPLMYLFVDQVGKFFDDVVPSILIQKDLISKVIKEEELSFLRTLQAGLKKIEHLIAQTKENKIFEGKSVFELYDTYGFPYDLTSLIASEQGYQIDKEGFEAAMNEQKTRSSLDAQSEEGDWIIVNDKSESTFVGYDRLSSESVILRYQEVNEKGKTKYKIIFDKTPFYPGGGGQVGDTGFFSCSDEQIDIIDTKKENGIPVHYTNALPQDLVKTFNLFVDQDKRKLTENNHSATHLLHSALRLVLGSHVMQKGSLVNDRLLRFDFSHFSKLSDDELDQVESIVNQKINEEISLEEHREMEINIAKDMGATALFGEKYGEKVRVVIFDKEYSTELCGGTHVKNTAQIKLFKIISEFSIASGIRRIEAYTSTAAIQYLEDRSNKLDIINKLLGAPNDLIKCQEQLISAKEELSKENTQLALFQKNTLKERLIDRAKTQHGVNIIIEKIQIINNDMLKTLTFELKNSFDNAIIILAANVKGKPQISIAITESILGSIYFDASSLIKDLSREIQGGGGGQKFYATAGGINLDGLDNVICRSKEMTKNLILEK